MTFLKQSLFIIACLLCCQVNAQQISIDNSFSAQELITNNLVQGCVETSNIQSQVNGQINGFNSFAYFERATSNFPFENGIMLSTGNATSGGNTENTSILNEGQPNWATDIDLETALGITGTLNATSIEFDFVSVANQIQFNYILASEEYFGNFPCQYSDGFAFLIKEAGTSDPYVNIAVIPGTATPVNTNTIHDEIVGFCAASNDQFFEGYNLGDTNYNGRTTVMSANASIQPNVQYHIKLIIADQTDRNYDSAVFIEGNSFDATVDLGADIQTCAEDITLNGDINNPAAMYTWYLNNTIIPGESQTTLNVTQSGDYRVAIEIPLAGSTCLIEDIITVTLSSTQTANPISNYELCDDISADEVEIFDLATKDTEVLAAVPASTYTISYHLTAIDAQNGSNAVSGAFQNTSNPQTIFIRIQDTINGCLAYQSFDLIVNPLPNITTPTPLLVCDDATADGFTAVDLSQKDDEITNGNSDLIVTYHYTQNDADNGVNAIPLPYVNTQAIETLFVNVINSITGCASTTSLDIEVLNNPVINTDNHYIDACDSDHDGFATFDLTTIIDDVLEGLTGVNVTFHETQADADIGINAIANETNYNNIQINEQTIFIRVEDAVTGCASTTPIEVHTNLLLTAVNIQDQTRCDYGNDGIVELNLLNITTAFINDVEQVMEYNIDIDFYLTEDDRDNQINPIDPTVPFIPTSNPQTIYITITSPSCQEISEFIITLLPVVEFDPIDMQTVCDTDQDGFTLIDLSSFDVLVTAGQTADYNVTYFATENDADTNNNPLPTLYTNLSNPQTIFTRITANATSCADINSFDIEVLPAPISTQPSDIVICDDDQDGVSIVDLDTTITELVTNLTERLITFHNTQNDADNSTNPIATPSSYSANTETIFARIENTNTGCYSTESFEIIVNTLPVFIAISNYRICENASDDVADFIFATKDAEILNGQLGKEVLYFLNQTDADNNTNPIDKNIAYQNVSNPQTIFVRVQNLTDADCYDTTDFTIEVGTNPVFNEPTNWFVCDDITNDGSEIFDLNVKISEISAGITDTLDITFYTSLSNAENQVNPVPLQYANTANPQQLFAVIDNGTICNSIASFELNVIQVPEVNLAQPIMMCDHNYDGIVTFDLTQAEFEVLDVRQDNITVTYFETMADLESDTNPIQNPNSYTNLTNPQTVFIKITNTISNCFVAVPLELIVNLPPVINDFQTYEICDNINSSFDLNDILTVAVDDTTDRTFSFYNSLVDAEAMTNALGTNYTYQTNNDTIFIRVAFNNTSCFAIYSFNIVVNPLPIANQPNDLQACDDASNDNVASFNLFSQNSQVLGNQNNSNYTVSYYTNIANANTAANPLPENYTGLHGETIFVRIENNTTSCFSTTQFNLIVNTHPNTPTTLQTCDEDFDGLAIFDLTLSEGELFSTINPDNVISYFESMSDLNADINVISTPTAYQNTSNPQTVFIKVYNQVANCFTSVSLDLDVNLPPAINDFGTYEACANDTNTIDLTAINSTLLDQTANVLVSYYTTEDDARNETNVLNTIYNYQTNNDTLFARVEFSTTHCFTIYEFTLQINPLPVANQPTDMEVCDDDYDGFFEFNLTQQNTQILGGQNPNNFTITYYIDDILADEGLGSIGNTYNAMTNETIYARIENNTTGCYSIIQFMTVVFEKPIIDIDDQVVCLDNLPLLVSANTNNIGDTYLWSTGETSPEIEITDIGTYSVTVTTPNACETTRIFSVSESEAATIEITESVDFSDPNNITVTVSGIGNYSYQLDDNPPQQSNVFENVSLGYHTITIIDLNGCGEVSKEIVVIDAPKFFTPNNDSYFDTWHITGVENLTGTIVYIYDRYGKLLKTLTSNSRGWDGFYNGNLMPANDYWFVADVRKENISFQVKGHFTLRL
ncbi:gliding motility-associated C-terminal domain-containing protein [Formosa sp. Hel1_31_208]|uniref:T9SS type B sorting domain-containing protein n=1 Tax=Formosa sp. Hel1_31_208 TaxID=1798225 RepID=UPI00087CB50E|nr:choice-of-anchor L domain-containing protein [Formosa sp. Hel1_31_208]SDS59933.1 gliding motility-associated C-terminal domain-containing protein [Formosa sp. Hel1_31_208]